MIHIYNGLLLSHKKERIWVGCTEADEPRICYTEWTKSEREKQISYINAYIWNLEKGYWWAYLQGRNREADVENGLAGTARGQCADRVALTRIIPTGNTGSWREHLHGTGSSAESSVTPWRGGLGVGRGLKRKGIYGYLQLIHAAVWQKLTRHCKAIILWLKIIFKKNVLRTFLVVQWLRLQALKTGGPSLIPSQGTGSHMLINKIYIFFKGAFISP